MHQDQDQRMAAAVAKLDEVVKERDHHEQKALALMAKFENTNQVNTADAIMCSLLASFPGCREVPGNFCEFKLGRM